ISFVEKKDDDSHTNLGFSSEDGSLYTRPLNEAGDKLSLNYERFTLEWVGKAATRHFRLDGSTHAQILAWIKQMVTDAGIDKPYIYKFHYDLPYQVTDDFTFKLLDAGRLQELLHLRILAQMVLESFLQDHKLDSEIRIWPHHFDTGAYASLNDNSGPAIGLGLAIPDSDHEDHYFYIAAYKGHDGVDISAFDGLTNGTWHNNG
ncbi:unnamed protein product, partial [Ectocarpus sp. 4 AP-2014]